MAHSKPTFSRLGKRKPHLARQLNTFFANQSKEYLRREPHNQKLLNNILDWSKGYVEEFLLARSDRANDVASDEIKTARKLELDFIGPRTHHFMVVCMDGRNMPAVMLSHVPHVGGVMRTQAGELFGFLESSAEKGVFINHKSYVAKLLSRLLLTKTGDVIYYSLDSHIGCAARSEIHNASGGLAKDGGLRSDIRRKLLIARGIIKLAEDLKHQGHKTANIYPQFFSYDPHDGTLTMGLELFTETVGFQGYTAETLKELNSEKRTVSTWQFLHDPKTLSFLQKLVKKADYRRTYAKTLLYNWKSITALYAGGRGEVYLSILEKLQEAYKKAGWIVGKRDDFSGKQIQPQVLEHKAKVMLKNLVTRFSIAGNDHHWPFDTHGEQGIVLTEGGYAPFPSLDVFSLYSKEDIKPLLDHTYLALQLVRAFRRKGSIKDPLSQLSGDEFVRTPVIIINKSILRDLTEDGWQKLQKVDLTEIFPRIDWNRLETLSWAPEKFENFLNLKALTNPLLPSDTVQFINGAYEVFDRLRAMMLDYRFRPLLLHAQVLVINVLVDRDRRTRLLVPLIV